MNPFLDPSTFTAFERIKAYIEALPTRFDKESPMSQLKIVGNLLLIGALMTAASVYMLIVSLGL